MADYDPELQSGIEAWNSVIDDRAEAELEKRRAQREGDRAAEAYAQRRISACNAELRGLAADYNEYMARKYPPQPAPISDRERLAKPMDSPHDWDDTVAITRTSKYCKNIRRDDPDLVRGWQELQNKKAGGG